KPAIAGRAHVRSLAEYQRMHEDACERRDAFWDRQASCIDFFQPYGEVCRADFRTAQFAWFLGGKLHASFNCVDRHLKERAEQVAILWAAAEPGQYRKITYAELHAEVCRMANVLRAHGVRKGD